jgi:hypothetical protein
VPRTHGRANRLLGRDVIADDVELDPVEESVVVDRARVCGAATEALEVGFTRSREVVVRDRRRTLESVTADVRIALTRKPPGADRRPEISCSLGSQELKGRVEEWQSLLAHVHRRDEIEGGIRASFDRAAPLEELMRLVAAEQACCQFFDFAITVDTRGVALEVRAPVDAAPVVHGLFGAPS